MQIEAPLPIIKIRTLAPLGLNAKLKLRVLFMMNSEQMLSKLNGIFAGAKLARPARYRQDREILT